MLTPRAGDIWSYWWSALERGYYLLIEQELKHSSEEMVNWSVINLHNGKITVMDFRPGLDGYWRKET